MEGQEQRAALEAARSRAKAAQAACRRAAEQIAIAGNGFQSCGTCRVRTPGDVERARELIGLALANHGEVDVVVLAPAPKPTGPRRGEGER